MLIVENRRISNKNCDGKRSVRVSTMRLIRYLIPLKSMALLWNQKGNVKRFLLFNEPRPYLVRRCTYISPRRFTGLSGKSVQSRRYAISKRVRVTHQCRDIFSLFFNFICSYLWAYLICDLWSRIWMMAAILVSWYPCHCKGLFHTASPGFLGQTGSQDQFLWQLHSKN